MRHEHIVKARDRDVFSDLQAAFPTYTVDRDGHFVVGGDDGLQVPGPVQEQFHALIHVLGVIARHDVLFTDGKAVPEKRIPIAVKSLCRVQVIASRL